MEELFYLPPRAQAPVIDYGVTIGTRSRLAKREAHNRKLIARPNRRCSTRFRRFTLDSRSIIPMQVAGPTSTGARSSTMTACCEACAFPLSAPGGSSSPQPLNSTLSFVIALARHTAPSGISCASSNAPNPKGIQAHLPTSAP